MATKYNFNISVTYYCAYIPSARSQKYEFDEVNGNVSLSVPSVSSQEAPVAFVLSDYSSKEDKQTEIRLWNGLLWRMYTDWDRRGQDAVRTTNFGPEHLKSLLHPSLPYGYARNRQECVKRYRDETKCYILIDGCIWERCGEPRYVVNTFGLGHNHGGTSLFVVNSYNPNIPNKNYFSALDGERAVAYANEVASRRGDTKDVGTFEASIKVLLPEAVTIRPMEEHGEGDKFMNKINAITEAAPDATTAGLLAMMVYAKSASK